MESRRAESEDRSTRHRVTALLLEHGPQTASELAGRLGVSPAAVRRHLDALLATGRIEERQGAPGAGGAQRGRGRPARYYHLTDVGTKLASVQFGQVGQPRPEPVSRTAPPVTTISPLATALASATREIVRALNDTEVSEVGRTGTLRF